MSQIKNYCVFFIIPHFKYFFYLNQYLKDVHKGNDARKLLFVMGKRNIQNSLCIKKKQKQQLK